MKFPSRVLDKVWQAIVNRPRAVLAGVLLITSFFFYQLVTRGVPLDNSPNALMVSHDRALTQYQEAVKTFGDDRVMIVALLADDVFVPAVIERVRLLTRRIERVAGVKQVISLPDLQHARNVHDSLRVGPLIPATASADELKEIAQEIEGSRFIVGNLVSPDRSMVALNVFFSAAGGEAEKKAVAEIERIIENEFRDDQIHFAGLPYMDYRNDVHVHGDLLKFAPLTVSLILLTFYFAFRTWRGVVMPLATVAIGLIWTFGVMALMGESLTLVSMMLPVILMAIGSSYVIHVINQYNLSQCDRSALAATRNLPAPTQRAMVLHALRFIGPPVIVSATTTMAGFGSLAFTTIVGTQQMGMYASLGVGAVMIVTLTLVPAWLVLLKPSPPKSVGQHSGRTTIDFLLEHVGQFVTRRQMVIYVAAFSVALLAVAGIGRLRIKTDYLSFYPNESVERIGAERINAHLGGTAGFRIIVNSDRSNEFRQADALNMIVALQHFVETLPGIDRALSVADLVVTTNRLFSGSEQRDEAIPSDQAKLDQLFSQLRASAADSPIRFISDDASRTQIMVRSHLFDSTRIDQTLRRIDEWTQTNLPPAWTAYPTGLLILLNRTSNSVAREQARSLIIAVLSIFAMMALLFRSIKAGFVAMLPNAVPIIAFFGFMGWMGIDLNLNTSLVASIVLGLAVDNAAHLIRRYRQCCHEMADKRRAVAISIQHSGAPIIFANLTLALAFAIFAFSSFVPVRTGGLLSAVTIMACLISNMIFLPVLMNSRLLQVGGAPAPNPSAGSAVSAAVSD
ncbi:MAG: MMPL family transporter [Acidobacteriota bacterium]|nr:MMPL family transporter [Acidobacteriota bacterium]